MAVTAVASETRATASALRWNYSTLAACLILQLSYTAYTARVTPPRDFGAFAAASVSLTIISRVAGAGLSTYLLRTEVMTRQTVNTALRVSVVSGGVGCLAAQAAAPACAAIWGLPQMIPTVRLFGLFLLTDSAACAAMAVLRRIDHARVAALAETGAMFVGMTVGSLLLAAGWSPYGLVAARVVAPAVTLAVGWRWLVRVPLGDGPRVPVRDVLGVSGAFVGYGMIQMVATDVPVFCVTRLFGPAAVGQYSRALNAVSLPTSTLCQRLRCSVMPSMARINGEGRDLGAAIPDLLSVASAIAFCAFGVLAAVGPPALRLLLGPGWSPAGELLIVFSAGAPFVLLCEVGYAVDEIGKAMASLLRTQVLIMMVTAATVVFLISAGRSLLLIAASYCVACAIGHAAQILRWRRRSGFRAAQILWPYSVHALLGASLYVGGRLCSPWGGTPLTQIGYALLGMLPVACLCAGARRRLPVYRMAISRGLVGSR